MVCFLLRARELGTEEEDGDVCWRGVGADVWVPPGGVREGKKITGRRGCSRGLELGWSACGAAGLAQLAGLAGFFYFFFEQKQILFFFKTQNKHKF